jgi:hypothetical protein
MHQCASVAGFAGVPRLHPMAPSATVLAIVGSTYEGGWLNPPCDLSGYEMRCVNENVRGGCGDVVYSLTNQMHQLKNVSHQPYSVTSTARDGVCPQSCPRFTRGFSSLSNLVTNGH